MVAGGPRAARGKSRLGCRLRRQKVGASRKAGRRKTTDANPALVVGSSYKRAIETSRAGDGAGGTLATPTTEQPQIGPFEGG